MSFCPPQFTLSQAEGLRCTVQFKNTGTTDHAFDVIVAIGQYDPNTGRFNYYLINSQNDISTPAGQTATATIDFANLAGMAGTWDVLVTLADWNPSTGEFISLYDIQLCEDVLVIT
jgi:hypothetical protein